ncbi:MAG: hypothetical protein NT027_09745, partial [Proteobacteria bacterium]|nr:hypothetical protein [Pseudomonadota bacterium]
IYFVLRRLLITPYSASAQNPQTPPLSQPFNPGVGDQNSNANSTTDSKNGTKEFQYSKKEALFQSIREVGDEAKEQPKKVARILARWVMQSPELTRSAALFVKNCDIKTVEAVCKSMHPSDLEKIIAIQIDEFDPLGDENQRVIDRMRSDLAVLASEHLIKERPDPLNFLKVLSDEDIKSMLEDEDASTIAMVATQVPAHRMQKLYDQLSTEAMTVIIAQVSTLRNTTIEDFESIRDRLNSKAEKLATNLFTDKDRSNSLLQMIAGVKSPTLQVSLMHGRQRSSLCQSKIKYYTCNRSRIPS